MENGIEIITGPMFSGKSEELIKRITTLSYAQIKTLIVKPKMDNRFSNNEIVSRNGKKIECFNCENTAEIRKLFNKSYKVVIIDEAQFFDDALYDYVVELANSGTKVIVSGLDMDFKMKPFGIMPKLLAVAEKVTKLKAVCLICKSTYASTSFRLTKQADTIVLGDSEYQARCRKCHVAGTAKRK